MLEERLRDLGEGVRPQLQSHPLQRLQVQPVEMAQAFDFTFPSRFCSPHQGGKLPAAHHVSPALDRIKLCSGSDAQSICPTHGCGTQERWAGPAWANVRGGGERAERRSDNS